MQKQQQYKKHQHKKHYVPRPAPEAPATPTTTSWFSSITSYVSNVFWAILGYKPQDLITPAPCKECNQRAQSQPPPARRPLMESSEGINRSSSIPPRPKRPQEDNESQSLQYYAEKLRLKRLAKQQQQVEVEPPVSNDNSDGELAI